DPVSYVAVDISSEHLAASTARIAADYPALGVTALIADFTGAFRLPPPRRQPDTLAGLFTGSTIGNFTPTEALAFLRNAASLLKDARGGLLVGVDLKKDEDILNAAYNDAAGVTADFNLNLLDRINRELDGNFVRDRFRHRAFYNPIEGRIEMHLESLATQRVSVAGQAFAFAAGETIHTENSYKYAVEEFRALAVRAGFRPERVWTDDDCLFSIHYLRA
ncbi:MAG: L-histidine N(alpha)-methyltransferase, partial [Rhodospirillales bacterium]|nr:L-histidine N(alpha)-methyltransferase [Rhodospirillales bacterium]